MRSIEHRQALHHQRHGDRPGQDVERQRPDDRLRRARQGAAAGRPHHLPPPTARRPSAPSPATTGRHLRRHAQDPDRPLGRGERRRLRAGRPLAPPGTSRSPARTCMPRSAANAKARARSASSTPRRSARSRSSARRRHLPGADVHQPWRSSGSAAAATASCSEGRLHPR